MSHLTPHFDVKTPLQSHSQVDINAKSAESGNCLRMHNVLLNCVAGTQVNDPDFVYDVGYYLKRMPEQRSTTRASLGVFDSVVMKNSEVNHVGRNQINFGPQSLGHPGEDVKMTRLPPKKGVITVVNSTVNFADNQINVRRPNV